MIPHNTKGEVKKFDQQLQGQPKEDKVVSADRGTCNSWIDDQPTGQSALNASGIICYRLIVNTTLLDKINISQNDYYCQAFKNYHAYIVILDLHEICIDLTSDKI